GESVVPQVDQLKEVQETVDGGEKTVESVQNGVADGGGGRRRGDSDEPLSALMKTNETSAGATSPLRIDAPVFVPSSTEVSPVEANASSTSSHPAHPPTGLAAAQLTPEEVAQQAALDRYFEGEEPDVPAIIPAEVLDPEELKRKKETMHRFLRGETTFVDKSKVKYERDWPRRPGFGGTPVVGTTTGTVGVVDNASRSTSMASTIPAPTTPVVVPNIQDTAEFPPLALGASPSLPPKPNAQQPKRKKSPNKRSSATPSCTDMNSAGSTTPPNTPAATTASNIPGDLAAAPAPDSPSGDGWDTTKVSKEDFEPPKTVYSKHLPGHYYHNQRGGRGRQRSKNKESWADDDVGSGSEIVESLASNEKADVTDTGTEQPPPQRVPRQPREQKRNSKKSAETLYTPPHGRRKLSLERHMVNMQQGEDGKIVYDPKLAEKMSPKVVASDATVAPAKGVSNNDVTASSPVLLARKNNEEQKEEEQAATTTTNMIAAAPPNLTSSPSSLLAEAPNIPLYRSTSTTEPTPTTTTATATTTTTMSNTNLLAAELSLLRAQFTEMQKMFVDTKAHLTGLSKIGLRNQEMLKSLLQGATTTNRLRSGHFWPFLHKKNKKV
ncbi:hypothetical protein HDV05_005693, partial [Chytridiales sp. JEL 0842]